MILISEVPHIVKCTYDKQFGYTMHEWKTFFCDDDESLLMKEALEKFLHFVKDNKIVKHIVDVKKCTDAFTENDLDYISNYLVPKELEYGILYIANIVSEDITTQVTTDFWQEKVENGLIIKNVSTLQEAVTWLDDFQ